MWLCKFNRAPFLKERIAASSDQVQDLRVDLSKWRNKSRAGYKGVRQVGCRFEARTSAGGKGTRSLGYYNSAEEAARAYALDHLSHAQTNQKYSKIGKKKIDSEAEQCDTDSGATPSLPLSSLTEESRSPPPSTSSNSSSDNMAFIAELRYTSAFRVMPQCRYTFCNEPWMASG